jgi:integrase/recombinase XerC
MMTGMDNYSDWCDPSNSQQKREETAQKILVMDEESWTDLLNDGSWLDWWLTPFPPPPCDPVTTHENHAPTIAGAAKRYLVERQSRQELRPATVKGYRDSLNAFCSFAGRDRKLSSVNRRLVERWIESQSHLARATIRARLVALKGFFDWCVIRDLKSRNPTTGIRSPRTLRTQPRCLKSDQVTATLARAADDRERLVVLLMAQEALRAGEVARITLGDIDESERVLLVRGKGGHERVVPISDETWSLLTRLHPRWSAGMPAIPNTTRPGMNLKPATIGKIAADALQRAGVKASGHALRHTAANDMRKRGADLRDIQEALGHASIATTQRYVGLIGLKDLRQVMGGRRYGPGFDGIELS